MADGIEVRPPDSAADHYEDVLTRDALTLVAELQREFGPRRDELLVARRERQAERDAGALPDFLPATRRHPVQVGAHWFDDHGRADQSRRLLESVALAQDFAEFLTLPAYEELEG